MAKSQLSVTRTLALGLQHVLAMNVFIMPILLGELWAFSGEETARLVQLAFFVCGAATLIQANIGIRMPVMQGPSFIPLSALATMGKATSLAAVTGSLIPGAIVFGLLGMPFKIIGRIINRVVPPLVAGTIIMVLGISLIPIALSGIFRQANPGQGAVVAFFTVLLLVFFPRLSIVFALAAGSLFSHLLSPINFDPVLSAQWFSWPQILPFGAPQFHLPSIALMMLIYAVVFVESMGTWLAVGAVTDQKVDDDKINGGALGLGLSWLFGSFFGAPPVTGYSTTAGVIALTGVKSRTVINAGAILLLLLGFIPKFTSVIACIPSAAINGMFALICIFIMMNGLRIVRTFEVDTRTTFIVGIPVLLSLSTTLMPKDMLDTAPIFVQGLAGSGIAMGAIAAIILNLILPLETNKLR